MVYPALLPLMRTPRLPVADRTDAPADLNGLVRFAERRNLGSVCVCHHIYNAVYQHLCNPYMWNTIKPPEQLEVLLCTMHMQLEQQCEL